MSSNDVKELVLELYKLALQDKQPAEAARKYLGAKYTQHNPVVADGVDGFVAGITGLFEMMPDLSIKPKRVLADGDLVAIHSELRSIQGDQHMAVVDIFRVEDGKIVEHWDVLQPVPDQAVNNNT